MAELADTKLGTTVRLNLSLEDALPRVVELYPDLTVLVAGPGDIESVRGGIDPRVVDRIEFLGLVSEQSIYNLVERTVELARALAGRPKLLLLDEPAAGMNSEESQHVARTIERLRDELGITVLLVEHDMSLVMRICERIVVLDHGQKICEGTPDEVRSDPRVIEAYLGRKEDGGVA